MKKTLRIIVLALASLFFVSTGALFSETEKEVIKIYMGTNQVLSVSSPTRIAIGNPDIVDVVQVSKKEMTLAPKAPGHTTLVFWDNFGEQSYVVKVFAEDTRQIKERIDKAIAKLKLPGVSTKAEDEEGKVFLLGEFDTAGDKDRAFLAMGALKDKVVDLSTTKEDEAIVEIDVQVLELNKGSADTLGFTWPGSISLTEVASSAPGLIGTKSFAKLFELGNMTRSSYTLKLDALIQEGKARVLSRPRLSCLSGKEAKLLVGGEVPILSSTVTGGGTSGTSPTPGNVEYKEYGIILNIKPTVKDNNRIYLNLGVEVSEVGTAVSTSYALAYPFSKRTASTELYLDDGQTMAIGGLIKQKTEEELRKLPWLADVPVLGMFFRQKSLTEGDGYDTRADSELFITLTPRIVSGPKDDKKKDEKRSISPKNPVEELSLDPIARYSFLVQKRISDKIVYPVAAKGAGFQGTVILSLKFSYKGELLASKIRNSSGYKVLDSSALKAARSIPSYPPFPAAIEQEELWVDIPVLYQLD